MIGSILSILLLIGPVAQDAEIAEARFSTRNRGPLVGEPVELTLIVALPAGSTLVSWPDFPEQWAEFEIVQVSELVIIESSNGTAQYQQTILARLWEPGDYETPETIISVQTIGATTRNDLVAETLFLTVPSVLVADDEALYPPKAPVHLPYIPLSILVILAYSLFIAVTQAAHYWRVRRQQRTAAIEAVNIRALNRQLLASLQHIEQHSLEPAAIYSLVADNIRDYLRDQYGIAAHEMTTRELLATLQHHLPPPLLSRLQQLLGQADLVKFARYQPTPDAAQQYLEATVRWLQAIMQANASRSEGEEEVA